MLHSDIALLDATELRHFKNDSEDSFIPSQMPSIARQVTKIVIPDHEAPTSSAPLVVNLAVDASPGCGGVAWPAGRVLASHLVKRKTLEGLTVVELGSGTGLVGIVAGLLGAENVWITDQEPLLDLMRTSVALNELKSSVHVEVLNWGQFLPASIPTEPDLILAADCVYFEPAFSLLVDTLCALAASSKTEILFCYKKRRKADKRFFAMLKKEFTWSVVEDNPSCKDNMREGVFLYRLVRKGSRK